MTRARLSVIAIMLAGLFMALPAILGMFDTARAETVHFSGSKVIQSTDSQQQGNVQGSTQAYEQKKAKNDLFIKVFLSTLLVLGIITVIGVVNGLSDKAVFYEDGKDVIATFIPFVLAPVLAFGLAIVGSLIFGEESQAAKTGAAILWVLIEVAAIAYVFKTSYRQNDGKVGISLIMAVSKLCLSFFCLSMFGDLMSWDKNKTAAQNWARRANAAIWLTLSIALMKKLINGERVKHKVVVEAVLETP